MIGAKQFYKQYFNIDSPFDHQINIWDRVHAMELPLLLKAPTGSGKTEAVLAPFLSQFIQKAASCSYSNHSLILSLIYQMQKY